MRETTFVPVREAAEQLNVPLRSLYNQTGSDKYRSKDFPEEALVKAGKSVLIDIGPGSPIWDWLEGGYHRNKKPVVKICAYDGCCNLILTTNPRKKFCSTEHYRLSVAQNPRSHFKLEAAS